MTSLVGYAALNSLYGGVSIACDNNDRSQVLGVHFRCAAGADHAGGTGTSTLTLSTNLPVNVASVPEKTSPFVFAGLFGLGMLGLAFLPQDRAVSLRSSDSLPDADAGIRGFWHERMHELGIHDYASGASRQYAAGDV